MSTEKGENVSVPAWGGIGGSGAHSGEALVEIASDPRVAGLIDQLPKLAWGGVGGSGKHAEDLNPEVAPTSAKKY